MSKDNDIRNGSGYYDPVPHKVIKKMDAEEERFNKLLRTVKYICDLADFDIEGRIVLIDRQTGRIWR